MRPWPHPRSTSQLNSRAESMPLCSQKFSSDKTPTGSKTLYESSCEWLVENKRCCFWHHFGEGKTRLCDPRTLRSSAPPLPLAQTTHNTGAVTSPAHSSKGCFQRFKVNVGFLVMQKEKKFESGILHKPDQAPCLAPALGYMLLDVQTCC